MAPTLLELGGYEVPASMQGRSLVGGLDTDGGNAPEIAPDEEELVRDRLRGLGYLS
jgi:hypothetical protein